MSHIRIDENKLISMEKKEKSLTAIAISQRTGKSGKEITDDGGKYPDQNSDDQSLDPTDIVQPSERQQSDYPGQQSSQ